MAKVNVSKEEVEMAIRGLANIITIKHRYREVKMPKLDIDMIREVLHKLEAPFQEKSKMIDYKYNKIIRESEDKQPRIGNCECCDD